ncbi:hypothetical protein [Mammaliicoccus sciuri]|uniref:hypothetical protein n=1 Tax=Mammaliicoccus sciuri TaxID=1296 RepID=UPI003A8D5A95
MVTEAQRKAFEARKARIRKEVDKRAEAEGLSPRPSIYDRWNSDAKLYDRITKRKDVLENHDEDQNVQVVALRRKKGEWRKKKSNTPHAITKKRTTIKK